MWNRFRAEHRFLFGLLEMAALVAFAVAQVVLISVLRANGWGAEALWFYLGIAAVGGLLTLAAYLRK